MTATIFCTFEQRDFADLATGKLLGEFPGIHSILPLSDNIVSHQDRDKFAGLTNFSNITGVGAAQDLFPHRPHPSNSPAIIQIRCDQAVKDRVVARLINLHAHRISSTP